MSAQKYLIDTNVFIGLEDDHELSPELSSLINLAGKYSVSIFVHEAALDDIERDKNAARRNISQSKFKKFQRLNKVRSLLEDELANSFGPLPKPNDVVDATLLHALSIDAADFLVTQDRGLHERARRYAPNLSSRVLFIVDAVALLESTYEPIDVPVRSVEEVEAYEIPLGDDIFDSLREGYPEFDQWWREKCVKRHRKCWVVYDEGIAGLVVRKDETSDDTDAQKPASKILKICTFKVRPEKRGTKMGELLLKQVFWFAQTNNYDLTYLTTYPDQQTLIYLLEYYGFEYTYKTTSGELVYEKQFSTESLPFVEDLSAYDTARINYPRFCSKGVAGYGVPIKEDYHDTLFPELKDDSQPDLFDIAGLGQKPKSSGNTIRKVYLCRAPANVTQPGSLIFFYKGKSEKNPSQAITTIGVFEDMSLASSTNELMNLTGGRSVYSETQLHEWKASVDRPVKVINFLLAGYFDPAVEISDLRQIGLIGKQPPQSIFQLSSTSMRALLDRLTLGFEV